MVTWKMQGLCKSRAEAVTASEAPSPDVCDFDWFIHSRVQIQKRLSIQVNGCIIYSTYTVLPCRTQETMPQTLALLVQIPAMTAQVLAIIAKEVTI